MSEFRSLEIPHIPRRTLILATLVVVAVALAFWLVLRFHNTLLILFIAIVISTAMQPVVNRLYGLGVPRSVGVILVYLSLLILLVGGITLGAPLFAEQSARIAASLPRAYEQLHDVMSTQAPFIIRRLANQLPATLPLLQPERTFESSNAETLAMLQQVWNYLGIASRIIFGIIATLILAFYWTLSSEKVKRGFLLRLPQDKRDAARELIEEAEKRIGGYTGGLVILMLFIGFLSLIAYLLIGLPYALVLAIIAGLLEAIPVIGPGLGAVPAAIVAYSVDPIKVVWVILATLIIQQVENSLLVPRIMDQRIGVNPIVTLLAFIAFGLLLGVPGGLVAIPMAAVVQLLIDRFFLEPGANMEETVEGRDQLSVLRYSTQELVRDMRKRARSLDEGMADDERLIEDELEAIANDLEEILATYSESSKNGETT